MAEHILDNLEPAGVNLTDRPLPGYELKATRSGEPTEVEIVRAKLHGGSPLASDDVVLLESEHGREVASYHKALQDRYEEIVSLRDRIVVLEKGLRATLLPMDAALEAAKRENGGAGLIWADEVTRWRVLMRAALGGDDG
ncbi:MAG: hypothetical protein ACYDD0_00845 [Candidatus Dormibacteria bacterium]